MRPGPRAEDHTHKAEAARAYFNERGRYETTGVDLVDLTKLSSAYYGTLSSSAKSALFVDGTHFHEPGATQIANLVAQALKGMPTGIEAFV